MSGLGLLADDDEMVEDAVGPGSVGAGTRGTSSLCEWKPRPGRGGGNINLVATRRSSSTTTAPQRQSPGLSTHFSGSDSPADHVRRAPLHPPILPVLPLLTRPRSLTFFFAFLTASPHGARWWAALAVAAPLPDMGR